MRDHPTPRRMAATGGKTAARTPRAGSQSRGSHSESQSLSESISGMLSSALPARTATRRLACSAAPPPRSVCLSIYHTRAGGPPPRLEAPAPARQARAWRRPARPEDAATVSLATVFGITSVTPVRSRQCSSGPARGCDSDGIAGESRLGGPSRQGRPVVSLRELWGPVQR